MLIILPRSLPRSINHPCARTHTHIRTHPRVEWKEKRSVASIQQRVVISGILHNISTYQLFLNSWQYIISNNLLLGAHLWNSFLFLKLQNVVASREYMFPCVCSIARARELYVCLIVFYKFQSLEKLGSLKQHGNSCHCVWQLHLAAINSTHSINLSPEHVERSSCQWTEPPV